MQKLVYLTCLALVAGAAAFAGTPETKVPEGIVTNLNTPLPNILKPGHNLPDCALLPTGVAAKPDGSNCPDLTFKRAAIQALMQAYPEEHDPFVIGKKALRFILADKISTLDTYAFKTSEVDDLKHVLELDFGPAVDGPAARLIAPNDFK
jgi:hypothetical protein